MICTEAQYRRITKDNDTSSADVVEALLDAQADFESQTRRKFEYGTYTEKVRLIDFNRVYPKAVPVAAVTTPSEHVIDNWSVLVPYQPGLDIIYPFFLMMEQPWVEITYTGGYQDMPRDIVRAVALMAHENAHPVILTGVPSGATSASVGNVSVSGQNLTPGGNIGAYSKSVIDRYRRRVFI